MKTHHVAVGGTRYHLREEGEGFPLVFVHSLTYDGLMFEAQLEALASSYRVIIMDLPGHGRTEWEARETTLAEMADDVPKLLDALGIDKVGYCGHSTGGMMGVRLALSHSERIAALALMNTSAEAEDEDKRELYHNLNERTRGKPSSEDTCNFIMSLMFSESFRSEHPERTAPFFEMLMNPSDKEGLYWTGKAVIWRDSVLEELGRVARPTLVVVAKDDMAVPAVHGERIADAIPGARLWTIENSGHLTPVEKASEVSERLHSFFDEALG